MQPSAMPSMTTAMVVTALVAVVVVVAPIVRVIMTFTVPAIVFDRVAATVMMVVVQQIVGTIPAACVLVQGSGALAVIGHLFRHVARRSNAATAVRARINRRCVRFDALPRCKACNRLRARDDRQDVPGIRIVRSPQHGRRNKTGNRPVDCAGRHVRIDLYGLRLALNDRLQVP